MQIFKSAMLALFTCILSSDGYFMPACPSGALPSRPAIGARFIRPQMQSPPRVEYAPKFIYRRPLRPATISDPRITADVFERKGPWTKPPKIICDKIVEKPVIILEEETEITTDIKIPHEEPENVSEITISGFISDASGLAIHGAEIKCLKYDYNEERFEIEQQSFSSIDGEYFLRKLDAGKKILAVSSGNRVTEVYEFYLSGSIPSLNFKLEQKYSLTVRIIGERGEPILDGRVEISRGENRIDEHGLNSEGCAGFTLEAGYYTAFATCAGFLTASESFNLLEFEGETEINIMLSKGLSITGFVLDENGAPISEAWVTAGGYPQQTTSTDEFGYYRITGLKPGFYNVYSGKSGYYENGRGDLYGISAGSSDIILHLSKEGRVKISILGNFEIESSTHIHINYFSENRGGGRYCFDLTSENKTTEMCLRPGTYSFWATDGGIESMVIENVVVKGDETAEVNIYAGRVEIPVSSE
jgi:hypothetical protein